MTTTPLWKAIPVPRGCGERQAGGVYAECGVGPYGQPLERFLLDPPVPMPPELDVVNKPQIWPRVLPSGEQACDAERQPLSDLLIHIGAEHYPYVPDYLEETRRYGVSRRLNPNLDLSLLTTQSRMLLAHPKAIPLNWREMRVPKECRKNLPRHDQRSHAQRGPDPNQHTDRLGPSNLCLFKLWELLPRELAQAEIDLGDELPLCLRELGSTRYEYCPTGEQVEGWQCAFVLSVPITGFALIQDAEGQVNERAKRALNRAYEERGEQALPFYETPC
ncbi:MAG: hypothetical protein ABI413_14725 [Ktedonobacteraceae bacterium]